MQKWEYSFLRRNLTERGHREAAFIGADGTKESYRAELEDLLIELNELGEAGWEVVGYGVSPAHTAIWTLKRPKIEKQKSPL